MNKLFFLATLIAATAYGQTQLPIYEARDILKNGPDEERILFVYLGDGYTEAQREKFFSDAKSLNDQLFATEPFERYSTNFNVRAIFVASAEDGADIPTQGITRDTYFHSTFGETQDLDQVLIMAAKGTTRATELLLAAAPKYVLVITLVNSNRYGGSSGGPWTVTSLHGTAAKTLRHELGHTFGKLADEYDVVAAAPPYKLNRANATTATRIEDVPWKHWLPASTVFPTPGWDRLPAETLGVFEGAATYRIGVYRPHANALMRSLASEWGPVALEEMTRYVYSHVRPLLSQTPSAPAIAHTVSTPLVFTVSPRHTTKHTLTTRWFINEELAFTGSDRLVLNPQAKGNASFVVRAEVADLNPNVRKDEHSWMTQNTWWQVQFSEQPPPTDSCVVLNYAEGSVASGNSFVGTNGGHTGKANDPGDIGNPRPDDARLVNVSVRSQAGVGNETLIVGFVLAGSGRKDILIRGVGPGLDDFGIKTTLRDPKITVYRGSDTVAENDDWSSAIAARIHASGAFDLRMGSKDAAMIVSLEAGPYSVHLSPASGATGEGLIEVYDLATGFSPSLVNLSTRTYMAKDAVVIPGFVVSGSGQAQLLVRGAGPALQDWTSGVSQNPRIKLHLGEVAIQENDDWLPNLSTAFQRAGAFPFRMGSKDAAVAIPAPNGNYSVHVSDPENGGVVLVEVYSY